MVLIRKSAFLIILLVLYGRVAFITADSSEVGVSSKNAKQTNEIAYAHLVKGEYEQAYKLSNVAKRMALLEDDQRELARAISNIASNLYYLGNFEQALSLYRESLKIARDQNDTLGIDRALGNISAIYFKLDNFTEALNYQVRKYELLQNTNNTKLKAATLIGLSDIYIKLNDKAKAYKYYDLARKLLEGFKLPFYDVYVLMRRAAIAALDQNYFESIRSLEHALLIAKQNNFQGLEVQILTEMAEFHFKNNDTDNAKKNSLTAIKSAVELKMKSSELQNHQLLSEIYEKSGQFDLALKHSRKTYEMNQVITGEKVQLLAEVTKVDRQVYETQERLKQSEQETKIAQLELETQEQIQVIWTAGLISLSLLIIFGFYRHSSKKQIEQQIQVNNELKELDKLKDRILTNTSHELRTPLNGIIGLSDIIETEHGDNLDPEILESVRLIGKSGTQLSETVDDILDLARLKNRKMPFKYSDFDLISVINEVIKLCESLTNGPEVSFDFDAQDDSLTIHHDKKRVQQLLFNLIGNAAKFTENGSIRIRYAMLDDNVRISVSDTGVGIPADKIERIFEGFEQVNPNDNRSHTGSGLGLAISRELISNMNGSIDLQSELGIGTTVSIEFPVKKTETISA
ncbi:tetratricopeptide repeat-containing sensor histidine kinase [Aliikangiella coralliicola]|uniref:histidine kinase n=1 Tax=Aliikangiella coralliicola TaxID=2592383 RepID=A0A545UGV5_9GAMM|nr:ATP-binding protein [Aliikangiella coralliicola]TQV88643.1 sensor histidine kinase [Aliikangiella coralliicola]